MATKTECTTSRSYFRSEAKQLKVEITSVETGKVVYTTYLSPRQFQTGSMGWSDSGKADIPVGPVDVPKCQVGINVTLVGSKELPQADAKAA